MVIRKYTKHREQCYIGSYSVIENILGVLGLFDHVENNAKGLNKWFLNIITYKK